jgi:hypothetical protein
MAVKSPGARVERGVYRQPNGKYAVCFMLDGKPRFRTVDGDLDDARSARARLAIAAQAGLLPVGPRLTFAGVAGHWIERFEAIVAVGERRERTFGVQRGDDHEPIARRARRQQPRDLVLTERSLRPRIRSRPLARFESEHRVFSDVAAAQREAQDRPERRERADDRPRCASLHRQRADQPRDVIDRDRSDLSPPKGREEMAIKVVAVALLGCGSTSCSR